MNQPRYKASKPFFSEEYNCEMVIILERKLFLNFIPYWDYHDMIKNHSAVDEVIFLLNNPEEMKRRVEESAKKIMNK